MSKRRRSTFDEYPRSNGGQRSSSSKGSKRRKTSAQVPESLARWEVPVTRPWRGFGKGHVLSKAIFRAANPPAQLYAKFKSVFSMSLASTTGSYATAAFPINDAHDPTGSIGAAQGYFWDQLNDSYAYYQVVGYKIKMTPTIAPSGNPGILSTCASPASSFASFTEAAEQPYAKNRVLDPSGASDLAAQTQITRLYPHKVFGIENSVYMNDPSTYGTTVGASPPTRAWFNLGYRSLDGSTSSTTIIWVEITQTVLLHHLNVVGVS